MIHYIYKIIFLRGYPCGRYYLGKRSYSGDDLAKDSYSGSGSFCKAYFKAYGKKLGDTYLKEIIEINPSAQINRVREIEIIDDKWKTDPLCMNLVPGGGGGENCEAQSVVQYDLQGNIVGIYPSEMRAFEATNINNSGISNACVNKTITAGGYIWRFAGEPLKKSELEDITIHSKPIKQYTEDGTFIRDWDSAKTAGEELGIQSASIIAVCKGTNKKRHTAGGYLWSYYNKEPINNKDVPYKGKRTVLQIDPITDEVIAEFNSLADAANIVGGTWQGIQRVCNGKRNKCHGFKWKFSN